MERYILKGGSRGIAMLSRYIIDVIHNATLIIFFSIIVNSFGFALPGTLLGSILWVFLDPFFVYWHVFIFVQFSGS